MAQSFCSRYIEENETLSCLQISVFKLSGTISAVWENQQAENLCLKCREAFITVSSFESVRFFPFDGCLHAGNDTPIVPTFKAVEQRGEEPYRADVLTADSSSMPLTFSLFCLRLLATPWNLLVFWQRLLHARQALYCRATSPAPWISLLWF